MKKCQYCKRDFGPRPGEGGNFRQRRFCTVKCQKDFNNQKAKLRTAGILVGPSL